MTIKQIVILILFCCLVLSSGCATVMTGKYQTIPVTSEPPGIKVRADMGETIITPGKFHLIRNQEHTLIADYPGYEPQQITLHNKAQGWVWGNILVGGIVGLAIDCASGASDELTPKEIHFDFVNFAALAKDPNRKFIGYKVIDGKAIPVYEDVKKE